MPTLKITHWMACAVVGMSVLLSGHNALAGDVITRVEFDDPTDRYPHGVLGDRIEWGALEIVTKNHKGGLVQDAVLVTKSYRIELPQNRVFEDIAPRLVDLDGDGAPEIIVVESDAELGARLAVYDQSGVIAATPFIGKRFRWLAPIGAGDLDGDGKVEIAYIDRPHLRKMLRVWRFERTDTDASLVEIAQKPGLTNHRIGEPYISGGIRDCGAGKEMVTVDAEWRNVVITVLNGAQLTSKVVSAFNGKASVDKALECRS